MNVRIKVLPTQLRGPGHFSTAPTGVSLVDRTNLVFQLQLEGWVVENFPSSPDEDLVFSRDFPDPNSGVELTPEQLQQVAVRRDGRTRSVSRSIDERSMEFSAPFPVTFESWHNFMISRFGWSEHFGPLSLVMPEDSPEKAERVVIRFHVDVS